MCVIIFVLESQRTAYCQSTIKGKEALVRYYLFIYLLLRQMAPDIQNSNIHTTQLYKN